LAENTAQFLFMPTKSGEHRINIPLKRFGEPYYIMERGSIDMKMHFLLTSMQRSPSETFNIKQLEQVRHWPDPVFTYIFRILIEKLERISV